MENGTDNLREGGERPSLEKLAEQVSNIERLLAELQKSSATHVTVEHLHMYNPKIEDLKFSLESLHVEELSGALNMGNNFGVRVEQKPKGGRKKIKIRKKKAKPDVPPEEPEQPGKPEMPIQPEKLRRSFPIEKTEEGYRIRLNSPQEEGEAG